MKTLLHILILCVSYRLSAQQLTKLFGAHTHGNVNYFSTVNLPGFLYDDVTILSNGFSPAMGETTFDDQNFRYFIKSGSSILIISPLTGEVLDTIKNMGSFYNIEYDRISNSLVGINITGNLHTFMAYDLKTKTLLTKGNLAISNLVYGESTFDPINRRYFTMANLGMIVIDSSGVLTDVLCASNYLNGIEYDIASNRIYYLEWKGVNFDFTSIEANSCTVGNICSLTNDSSVYKGESTFDKATGNYYSRTNLGLIQININSGSIMKHPPTNNFGQMEFANLSLTGIRENNANMQTDVFPNPSSGIFNFSKLKPGSLLEIFNEQGQQVIDLNITDKNITVDLEKETRGIYFYRISESKSLSRQGKLVLQ